MSLVVQCGALISRWVWVKWCDAVLSFLVEYEFSGASLQFLIEYELSGAVWLSVFALSMSLAVCCSNYSLTMILVVRCGTPISRWVWGCGALISCWLSISLAVSLQFLVEYEFLRCSGGWMVEVGGLVWGPSSLAMCPVGLCVKPSLTAV